MKKLLTASTIALAIATSGSAAAHAEFDNDHCDIELNGNIQYQQGLLTIELENGDVMRIDDSHHMTINNDSIDLTSEQAGWTAQYYDSIEQAIPLTLEIAKEGVQIASVAVTEVFTELLGADDDLIVEFDQLFEELSFEIDDAFYADDGSFSIQSNDFEEDSWVSQKWEDQFEERVEDLIEKSMGKLLIAIGTQMLWSDGDSGDFEAKMENFEQTIEQRVESQAAALEVKADELCHILAEADYAEDKLQNSVSELSSLDFLQLENYKNQM